MSYNCATCKHAFQNASQNGFELDSNLNSTAVGLVKLCKLLIAKEMVQKWSNLQVSTQTGPITFCQLIQEGYSSDNIADRQSLSEKFRKKVKQKEHHCRCGSGAKKNEGRGPGNLTCLGQRCACYKEGKACVNCKCVGCKNPNGTSLNEFEGRRSWITLWLLLFDSFPLNATLVVLVLDLWVSDLAHALARSRSQY